MRRSIAGPVVMLIIGGLFLWNNFHPEASVFELLATYWPFLLILWGLLRLIEALWPREGEWRGGFSGGEVALIVLICIIGWGFYEGYRHGITWNAGGIEMFGNTYDYPVTAKASAQGMKRIVFDNSTGNVKVVGADTAEVEIHGHKTIRAYGRGDADHTNGATPVEIVTEGDHLVVRANQDHVPDNQRLTDDLEVTVPHSMAVEAHIRRGDLDISDVGGDVDLAASHGDVRLSRVGGNARIEMGRSDLVRALDVKGRMDINGQGSDLALENIQGQVTINGGYTGSLEFKNLAQPLHFEGARNTELHAQAIPGQITMDMGQFNGNGITGPVRLVTRSRDIRIGDFTQSLAVETERGDIQLQPTSPMAAIEARSGFGNIDFVVPDNAAFQMNATAERGDVVNDFGPPLERETFGRSANVKGKVGDGPMVRLTATRGSVEIRRHGTPSSIDSAPEHPPHAPRPPKAPNIKNPKDTEIKL
jgi:DUF4097 and DUF4098 domain-containing protein YvlB